MPTVVGILTIISMINTTSERLKARNFAAFTCKRIHVQEVFHVYLNKFEVAVFYFIIIIDLHRLDRSLHL